MVNFMVMFSLSAPSIEWLRLADISSKTGTPGLVPGFGKNFLFFWAPSRAQKKRPFRMKTGAFLFFCYSWGELEGGAGALSLAMSAAILALKAS